MLLNDDLPDAFDDWLGSLDGEEYIKYADQYAKEMIKVGRLSVLKDFDAVCAADMFVGFSHDEFSAVKKFFKFNKDISGWDK